MSAFSPNRSAQGRRILSLWLPRLPIDRIQRQRAAETAASAKAVSKEALAGSDEENPSDQTQALSTQMRGASREDSAANAFSNQVDGSPEPRNAGDLNAAVPCIVVAKHHNAPRIVALDDAATRYGLAIGLPLANARAICPHLNVFEADPAADARLLNAIAEWCDRFTPLVALDAPDGLWLDITGCVHLFGGEALMLRLVCDLLTAQGLMVSAAIAGTSICARTLTRHVHGRIVRPGGEAEAVKPLPVSALGAAEAVVGGLARAGLKTIGDVAARARPEITARFGADFTYLLEQALGQRDAPISPRKPLPDYIVEKRFAEPVTTEAVITATLSRLAATLVQAMAEQGKGARRLEALFFRTDGVVRGIAVDTGKPVTQSAVIDRLLAERLSALSDPLDPGFGFDLIRLAASRSEIVVPQQRDLDAHVHDQDELVALIDRLAARLGGRRVLVHLPQDSHIPERAEMAAPAQQHLAAASLAMWPARAEGEPPLRPLRLFERPEPIEVIAEVPDGPPARFVWRRASHAVIRAEGPERIAMEWWRAEGSLLTRDYFRVEDEAGLRFWLYRDGLYDRETVRQHGQALPPNWFMHGLFA
jgi:protein ImuB